MVPLSGCVANVKVHVQESKNLTPAEISFIETLKQARILLIHGGTRLCTQAMNLQQNSRISPHSSSKRPCLSLCSHRLIPVGRVGSLMLVVHSNHCTRGFEECCKSTLMAYCLQQDLQHFNDFFIDKEEECIIRTQALEEQLAKLQPDANVSKELRSAFVDLHGECLSVNVSLAIPKTASKPDTRSASGKVHFAKAQHDANSNRLRAHL